MSAAGSQDVLPHHRRRLPGRAARRLALAAVAPLVALAFAADAQAAGPAYVQGTSNSTSGTTMTVGYSASVGAGHLLVGMFRTQGTASVSDSVNGAWTKAAGSSDGVNTLWYKANAKAGSTTVTVTSSTSGSIRAVVAEYSGVATSSPLDGTSCNSGTGTTATTGSTASVAAGELAFAGVGMFESPITITAGSGATLRTQFTGSNGTSADEDVLSTSAGAQSESFGLSSAPGGGWSACVATFKPPPPAGPFVQGASNSTSGTSMTVSYGSSVAAGHLLVGMVRTQGTGSVSDSLNGAWTKAVGSSDGINSLWYMPNAKAGSTTVTVTSSTSGSIRAVVAEYSGVATSSPLDGKSCNTGTTTTATTGSTATVPSGELAFAGVGMFESPITVTAGSGATLRTQFTGSNGTSADEDVASTTSGAQNESFGLSSAPAGGWSACVATFKPNSAPPPPSCTQTLNPGADVGAAVTGAAAGSVICLNSGTYTSPSIASSHGTSAQHVVLTSASRSSPATLNGRFTVDYSASYIDFNHLKFTPGSSTDETGVISSPNDTFTYNDVSGGTNVICLVADNYSGYAADNLSIDHNTIHDCGNPANTDNQIHAQGVYSYGSSNVNVTNNWCWNVAARCYQIDGGTGGVWTNNVADNANWAFIFGELTPTNIAASNNIVGPDAERYDTTPGDYAYGGALVAGMTNGGTGDTFENNCISSQNSQIYGSDPGLTVSNNTVANVQFVNASGHNYAVAPGSPCQGFGAQGTPGP